MSAGRIETYLHSDATTPNKGGAMVKVACQTDFAARTISFVDFAKEAARSAFGACSTDWNDVIDIFPALEADRIALSERLRETIEVTDIVIIKV